MSAIGYLSPALIFLGLILEIWGVIYFSNVYVRQQGFWGNLRVLLAAAFGRTQADIAAEFSTLSEESKQKAIRGLGKICLGFLLQVAGLVVGLVFRN